MGEKILSSVQWAVLIFIGTSLLAFFAFVQPAAAQINPIPNPEPQPGSFGVEATKTQPPPTQPATITTPGNNGSFTTSPITVSGICPDGLLVQVYNNGVMVGATLCENGSFTIEVSLFAGLNEINALVFDDLEQAGPVSNTVSVTYTDVQFTAFGDLITLTSIYGRLAAPPNASLNWPLQLSGGSGPYAFSINWGDGTPSELRSQAQAGVVPIAHVYQQAGVYPVNIQVTDANGVSAFLQVIGVSSGQVEETEAESEIAGTEVVRVLWVPAAIAVALLIPTFWLGRRSQIVSLRKKMLKERANYDKK